MALVRSIGRVSLTALVVNCIIGSGIFAVPGRLMGEVGRASPLAMIVAGLIMSVIVACFAEVGSQFSEPGGVYLYARTCFGRFVGLEVGWFWFLSSLGGVAANANLFVEYLGGLAPWTAHGWPRFVFIAGWLFLPAVANYVGVRSGTRLSNLFTLAKLLPLALLIALGVARFSRHAEMVSFQEMTAPGWGAWANALLMLVFTYSGFEDTVMPTGEVKEPRRSIPFGLFIGLAICTAVFTLLQFVVVATVSSVPIERPLAPVAFQLLGGGGALFVQVAAMISTYGWVSASMLNAPRFLFSLADRGDFPAFFAKLHPRFNTPHLAVIVFAGLAFLLAAGGTFMLGLDLSVEASILYYTVTCAALLKLRRTRPSADAFRLPLGPLMSVLGIGLCLVLLTRIKRDEAVLMVVAALIAATNWWWARRRGPEPAPKCPPVPQPDSTT
jgi:amino acid transporter